MSRSPQSGNVGLEFDCLTSGYRINIESTLDNPFTLRIPSHSRVISAAVSRHLRLHAACAQVAHLSGAEEYIDQFFREMEDKDLGSQWDVCRSVEYRIIGHTLDRSLNQ